VSNRWPFARRVLKTSDIKLYGLKIDFKDKKGKKDNGRGEEDKGRSQGKNEKQTASIKFLRTVQYFDRVDWNMELVTAFKL
jgi:hypothetical protein